MAFGVDVTPDKVRFVDYPNSSIPPGSFTSIAQLLPEGKRRVALLPIGVNEPILASKMSGDGQGASIAALLPDGMRAATVRINDVSGVAGFVQPNDTVDVLITRQIAGAASDTQLTDVLLQNVRVIAIDQQAKNADGTPKVARTATLEVTPIDAQKLALAQQVGSLSLVLRKPGRSEQSGRRDGQHERPALQYLRRRALSGARGGRRPRRRDRRVDRPVRGAGRARRGRAARRPSAEAGRAQAEAKHRGVPGHDQQSV